MNIKKICTTFIILFCGLYFYAQESKFELLVSNDTVLVGNYIIVDFVINNTDGNFEAPSFGDFDVLRGPNISSSFQTINGVSSNRKTYSYYLEPRKIGSFIIAPAFLSADELYLETTPLEIVVLPNPEQIIDEPSKKKDLFFEDWNNRSPFDIKNSEASKKKKASKWKKRKI